MSLRHHPWSEQVVSADISEAIKAYTQEHSVTNVRQIEAAVTELRKQRERNEALARWRGTLPTQPRFKDW